MTIAGVLALVLLLACLTWLAACWAERLALRRSRGLVAQHRAHVIGAGRRAYEPRPGKGDAA